ncbi:hypothetical protein VP01_865g1 [Puccinia sorghi]|uniref:Uncharacterized protein n=1 Tax=Puccinia sorghi TaxID=27349 RepID=A0A0L6U8W0_9BASI|nr:hypothetical protein VP01_865g1 [Puccinia sorghi]
MIQNADCLLHCWQTQRVSQLNALHIQTGPSLKGIVKTLQKIYDFHLFCI